MNKLCGSEQGKNVVGEQLGEKPGWGVKPPEHPWGRGTTEGSKRPGQWGWSGGSWDDLGRWLFGDGG